MKGYIAVPYTDSDIDFFATWYKGETYLVPIQECGVTIKTLRIIPPKNNQNKRVSFLKDYKAKDVLENLIS